MITEDYVSYETAKLLKKKGFDEFCSYYYRPLPDTDYEYKLEKFFSSIMNSGLIADAYTAPTIQMAMKWLREVHKIAINIGWGEVFEENYQWWCIILNQNNGEILRENEYHKTYEEACEAAIKYCLEKLI